MKAKAIKQKKQRSYKFFLLLIVPVLIGFMIFFSPQAHSNWDQENQIISEKTPTHQGWSQVEFKEIPMPDSKESKKEF